MVLFWSDPQAREESSSEHQVYYCSSRRGVGVGNLFWHFLSTAADGRRPGPERRGPLSAAETEKGGGGSSDEDGKTFMRRVKGKTGRWKSCIRSSTRGDVRMTSNTLARSLAEVDGAVWGDDNKIVSHCVCVSSPARGRTQFHGICARLRARKEEARNWTDFSPPLSDKRTMMTLDRAITPGKRELFGESRGPAQSPLLY